jgi:hypothetical protein
LPLIASLAETVQLGHDAQKRTEVRMTFSLAGMPAWGEVSERASSESTADSS